MSDPTVVPNVPQVIVGNQGLVDKDAAEKATARYRGALSQTQGQIEKLGGVRQDITTRNLAAIDEAITGLKDSRTGTYGFDPAVSGALAAGLLKPTSGGFLAELGQGMAHAAPVIGNLQRQDRDSYSLLADLYRKRGDYEAEPVKESLAELRAREKEEQTGLRAIETAGLRTDTADSRAAAKKESDQAKLDQKNEALRVAQMEKAQNGANADLQAATVGAEFLTPEQRELLRRDFLQKRIDSYNNTRPAGTPPIENPEPYDKSVDGAKAEELRRSVEAKSGDQERTKAMTALHKEAENAVPKRFNPEVWRALSPDQQAALIDEELVKNVERYNANLPDDPKKHLRPPSVNADLAKDARIAAEQTRNIGTPTKEAVEKANLPAYDMPNAYAGMTYEQRTKAIAEEQKQFNDDIKGQRATADTLGKRREQANRLWSLYNQTDRTGMMGHLPALGSAPAETFDKEVADLQLGNFPKGQGAISDGERAIMAKSVAARQLQPEALKIVLDTYVQAGQRANDEVAFKEAWFRQHKTVQGATEAWNRYINSPEGVFMTEDAKGNIIRNNDRQTWQQYFADENKGGGPLKVGDVREGYKFMGGRRGDPKSWVKVE